MEINVNKVEDSFYRYKMPRLQAKVEGKGNGIKTVIVNMSDIAKSLNRKPSYPTKYFGFELGAQIKLDERHDRYIVNGSHDANKLQEILFGFIKKFVLCQSCDNPETSLLIKKPNLIYRCRACGHTDFVDPTHRLTAFIMKNPPETELEGAFIEPEDGVIEDVDENVESKDKFNIENLSINETVEEYKSSAVLFKEYLEDLHNVGKINKERAEIVKKAKSLDIGSEFILILMEVIFCNRDTIFDDMVLNKNLFIYFTRQENGYQYQDLVLVGMEQLIETFNILDKSCHFLKALYDNDIVEEETILRWHENGDSSSIGSEIRKECKKMIDWLVEAEEESDSD